MFTCFNELLVCGVLFGFHSIGKIFAYRTIKNCRLLSKISNMIIHTCNIKLCKFLIVDHNASSLDIIESENELDYCTFTATTMTNKSNFATTGDSQIKIIK